MEEARKIRKELLTLCVLVKTGHAKEHNNTVDMPATEDREKCGNSRRDRNKRDIHELHDKWRETLILCFHRRRCQQCGISGTGCQRYPTTARREVAASAMAYSNRRNS